MTEKPEVTKTSALSMQVCVPEEWTDDQVTAFANERNPAGTTLGWGIRRAGDPALGGDPERVSCSGADSRSGYVHVMLDC